MTLSWVIVLFLLGILFLLLEAVLPGAVLGIVGCILMIVSIVYAFSHSLPMGLGMIAFAITVVPLTLYYGLRRLALRKTLDVKDGWTVGGAKFDVLSGKSGVSLTPLHPSGMAQIDENRVDVITDGELLDAGVPIRVVRVEGNKVLVQAEPKPKNP